MRDRAQRPGELPFPGLGQPAAQLAPFPVGSAELIGSGVMTQLLLMLPGVRLGTGLRPFHGTPDRIVWMGAGAVVGLPSIRAAIAAIDETAWAQITYPTAVPDPDTGELISGAQVAEVDAYTAFTSRPQPEQPTARLIVRRVRDAAKPATVGAQGELFPIWRYHPFFTDNPAPMVQAESEHRRHAVVEQVIADSKAGALAHLPSAHFQANAAWLILWTMTYNLLRAAGSLASAFHTKATTATLRAHLVCVPARLARSARRLRLHLPQRWPWKDAWEQLFESVHDPPGRA